MKKRPVEAIGLLEETLGEVNAAVADCFAQARDYTPENDEFGHRRTREIQDAATLLKMCAELGLAIAKINGQFHHDITVARKTDRSGADPACPTS